MSRRNTYILIGIGVLLFLIVIISLTRLGHSSEVQPEKNVGLFGLMQEVIDDELVEELHDMSTYSSLQENIAGKIHVTFDPEVSTEMFGYSGQVDTTIHFTGTVLTISGNILSGSLRTDVAYNFTLSGKNQTGSIFANIDLLGGASETYFKFPLLETAQSSVNNNFLVLFTLYVNQLKNTRVKRDGLIKDPFHTTLLSLDSLKKRRVLRGGEPSENIHFEGMSDEIIFSGNYVGSASTLSANITNKKHYRELVIDETHVPNIFDVSFASYSGMNAELNGSLQVNTSKRGNSILYSSRGKLGEHIQLDIEYSGVFSENTFIETAKSPDLYLEWNDIIN